MIEQRRHPSHETRVSDASSFDEICIRCGARDVAGGGWGELAEPCKNPALKTAYVCGLLFHRDSVLLVRKTRPSWQAGLLNGIGGKIESGELAAAAMVREFREETTIGLDLQWRAFCVEEGSDYVAHFFAARLEDIFERPRTPEKNDVRESLRWVGLSELRHCKVVGNLRWLVPLALDWREKRVVEVLAISDIVERPTW